MFGRSRSYILALWLALVLSPTTEGFSWRLWNPLRSKPPSKSTIVPASRDISKQAAADTHQDVLIDNTQWYDIDGIPLFYSAWRVREGEGRLRPEPTMRSAIMEHGARVACWPSSGGVWIKAADIVDLDFLGLDRLSDTARQFNQTSEDEFCTILTMVGASWWPIPPPFEEQRGHLGKE